MLKLVSLSLNQYRIDLSRDLLATMKLHEAWRERRYLESVQGLREQL